jgi:hypothetical protein
MSRRFCPNCVQPVARDALVCDHCMTDLSSGNRTVHAPRKTWSIARLFNPFGVWVLVTVIFAAFAWIARSDAKLAQTYISTFIAVTVAWWVILFLAAAQNGLGEAFAFMYRCIWSFREDQPLSAWRLAMTGFIIVGLKLFILVIKPAFPPGTKLVPW